MLLVKKNWQFKEGLQFLDTISLIYYSLFTNMISYYNQLLNEQARRIRAEQSLLSFEALNISQLKDRLTRVEQSNHLLRRSVHSFIDQQHPVYKSTVYIPKFGG